MVFLNYCARILLSAIFVSSAFAGIPAGYTGKPYQGTPLSIPGKFFADRADSGARNVTYYHPGGTDYAGMLKPTGIDFAFDCVLPVSKDELTLTKGYKYWAYIEPNEWMKATINVTTAGKYQINWCGTNGLSEPIWMKVVVYNGADSIVADSLKIPYIGSCGPYDFHSWFIAKALDTITLSAGLQVLRVQTESNGPFNVLYTELVAISTAAQPVPAHQTKSALGFFSCKLTGTSFSASIRAPSSGAARLDLFDARGRIALSADISNVKKGENRLAIEGAFPAGIYLARLTQAGSSIEARVVLTK
jgi:hypothetical protein